MDNNLRSFLEKFAELERRVRKLAAENRGLRDEVSRLSDQLSETEAVCERLSEDLSSESAVRKAALTRVDEVLDWLDRLADDPDGELSGDESGSEVKDARRA